MNTISSTLYSIFEWISRLAFLQLLWILFTIIGGFIFGFFPSTIAMYSIIKKWLNGETEIKIFSSFWYFFKLEFFKANKLGVIIYIVSIIYFWDFVYIHHLNDSNFTMLQIFILSSFFIFILFLFYLFPSFVYFNENIITIIKNSLLIMLINPIVTFFMLVNLILFFVICNYLPALYLFFSGSVTAFITSWLSQYAFSKIKRD